MADPEGVLPKPEVLEAKLAKEKLDPSVRWIVDLSPVDDRIATVLFHSGVTSAPILLALIRYGKLDFPDRILGMAADGTGRSPEEFLAEILVYLDAKGNEVVDEKSKLVHSLLEFATIADESSEEMTEMVMSEYWFGLRDQARPVEVKTIDPQIAVRTCQMRALRAPRKTPRLADALAVNKRKHDQTESLGVQQAKLQAQRDRAADEMMQLLKEAAGAENLTVNTLGLPA